MQILRSTFFCKIQNVHIARNRWKCNCLLEGSIRFNLFTKWNAKSFISILIFIYKWLTDWLVPGSNAGKTAIIHLVSTLFALLIMFPSFLCYVSWLPDTQRPCQPKKSQKANLHLKKLLKTKILSMYSLFILSLLI